MKKEFKHINQLLDKYWEGDTSLEEEQVLRHYFSGSDLAQDHEQYRDLFFFFAEESKIKYSGKFEQKVDSKRRNLFPFLRVAASVLVLVGASWFFYHNLYPANSIAVDKWAKYEIQDPQKAKEVAIEALAFLSVKLNKGEASMKKNFKVLEKIPVK